MDLANLGFVVETKSIENGIQALRQLQAAALGVTQTFKSAEQSAENLGKTTEQSEEKSAQATEQSTKRKKKTQDDYLTFLSNALDKELARELQAQQRKEQAQKSSAKSASKVVNDSAQEEQSAIDRTIEKLRIKKQEIAAGARSSEATAVAIAKLGGASEQQIKTIRDLMREINSIGGKNPFDSVVGELRRVNDEARAFQAIIDASNKEVGLTAKELQEIASLTSKINSIGKDTGATQDEINRRVEAATLEYKEQVRQKNLLKQKVDDIAEAERIASQAASANKRVQEQISAELKKQALLKEGFSKREAGFIVSAGRSGVAEVDAIALLAAENTTEELAKANEKLARTSKDVAVAYDAQVRSYEKNQDSVQRNLEATRKKLEQVKIEASLAAQGLSRTTAVGVVNLQQRGASKADIDTYVQTRKEIERITEESRKAGLATQGLSTILRQISPAVGAVGVVATLTQIGVAAIRAADTMTLLKSRMKLVLDETQNFDEVYKGLIETSVQNRASLTDTVTLFVRLTPALKAAGIEADAANKVVDSFQKTLLISGATTRETSAAILQFSQAMAAGRLNGDEFRSISEAAPEFLRAFSKATGIAAGALKELSAEGLLTTQIIADAMLVMNEELTKAANGIELSLGQAIQILGTRLTQAADSFNTATNATGILAAAVFEVSEIFGAFADQFSMFEPADKIEGVREMSLTVQVLGYTFEAVVVLIANFNFVLNTLIDTAITFVRVIGSLATLDFKDVSKLVGDYNQRAREGREALDKLEKSVVGVTNRLAEQKAQQVAAKKSREDLTTTVGESSSALQTEAQAIEDARSRLNDFGISYVTASGASGEYKKKTQELTDAYIRQAVSAEGLYLIEKNLLELQREQTLRKASQISLSDMKTEDREREYTKLVADAEAMTDLLGLMELREKQRVELENRKRPTGGRGRGKSEAEKAADEIKKLVEAEKQRSEIIRVQLGLGRELTDTEKAKIELVTKYGKETADVIVKQKERNDADQAALDLIKEYNDQEKQKLEAHQQNIKSLEDEIAALSREADLVGKSAAQIREYDLDKKRAALTDLVDPTDIARLKEEIKLLEERNKVAEIKEDKQKILDVAENTKKEFEKIQDDIAKSITDAIISGGEKGKDVLKNMFKAQIFRIFVEPVIRGGVKQITDVLNGKGSLNDLSGLAETLAASSLGGGEAVALQAGLQKLAVSPQILKDIGNTIFFDASSEFLSSTGKLLADSSDAISSFAGELAPYAGSIISFVNGDYASGIGSAAGVAIAGAFGQSLGSFAGPIGAFVGGIIGEKLLGGLFGGGKISARGLDAEELKPITDATQEGFNNLLKSLGGIGSATFGISGNTGRQGENPNFNLTALVGGKSVFSSGDTAEGQADGLFLKNEIALNDKNIAEQTTRAIVAGLKLSDFADNIDKVFKSVNPLTDSLEVLNQAIADAQLLQQVNVEFAKLDGALKTLAGASLETFKTFVALAGGVENLAALQSAYIESIYSDEEKLKLSTDNLGKAFEGLNLSVPKSTAEFRKLVDSQDLTTVSGQATYVALLQVSTAFAEVTKANKEATAAIETLASAVNDNISKVKNDFKILLNTVAGRTKGAAKSIASVLDLSLKQPQENIVDLIFESIPDTTGYEKFIDTIGEIQPSSGKYLSFVKSISGLTPNTLAYKAFTDAVSKAKPTDKAYADFVKNVSGLKPTETLYKAFVDAVSNTAPSTTVFSTKVSEVQSSVDSLKSDSAKTAIFELQSQIEQLQNQVSVVDFSEFTTKINQASGNISKIGAELSSATDVGTRLQLEDQLHQAIVARYEAEQEMLGGVFSSIQELFGSIKDEQIAVREAAIDILGGPRVLSPEEIRAGIRQTAAVGQGLTNRGAAEADARILSANDNIQRLSSALLAQQSNRSSLESNLMGAQGVLTQQIEIAKQAVALFNSNNRVGSAFATNSAGGLSTASFDQATLRAALDYAYITYNVGDEGSVGVLRNQLNDVSRFSALMGESIVGAIESANGDIVRAQDRIGQIVNSIAGNNSEIARTSAELAAAQTELVTAEQARAKAEQTFAEDLQKFVIDAGKATGQLGKLREETVRYFQEQQRLAETLSASSQNLRQTVADIRFNDLNPQQQLAKLQAEFASAFNRASSLEGDALAQAGTDLNALINPILQKASEVFASGGQFQSIKESILSQADIVASRIEALTPVNYQQESLALLDLIDNRLLEIELNTASAEQLIVEAIGISTNRTVQALSQIYTGITGREIPGFSTGGYVSGAGTGTSDSINAKLSNGEYVMPAKTVDQFGIGTMNSIRSGNLPVVSGGQDNSELVAEIRALRQDVRNTGEINIKVVTEDGKVVMEKTIKEIKERSRKGELTVYAKGVK